MALTVLGTLMLPFGFFFIGIREWVWDILFNMSVIWISVLSLAVDAGTSMASWLRDEMTSAIDLELVIISGL